MITLEKANEIINKALKEAQRLIKENRLLDAEVVLNQLVKIDPENQAALQTLGIVKYGQRKFDEGAKIFSKALESEPDNHENHNNLSLCYLHLGKFQEVKDHINKAIELAPDNHSYYSNLGMLYRQLGEEDEAIDAFMKSLEIKPNDPHVWIHVSSTYGYKKDLESAIKYLNKALEYEDLPDAHVDLAHANFLAGNWKKGFEEYEHRMENSPQANYFKSNYNQEKRWIKGNDLNNKKLTIYCEQGRGDFLQFLRYVPEITKKYNNVKISFHVESILHEVLKDNGYQNISEEIVEHDYHCSIMSLPYLLDIDVEKFDNSPYLKVSKKADFSSDDYKGKIKIGIAWAGNPQHPNDINRSVALNNFKPIYNLPNVKLFSLQKDIRNRAYWNRPEAIDLTADANDMKIVDMAEYITNFQDTAAIINELDLIISADTGIIHLAGALGKETWVLIPFNPDWRWGFEGNDTFWYPTLKLYRQKERYSWKEPFQEIAEAIKTKFSIGT